MTAPDPVALVDVLARHRVVPVVEIPDPSLAPPLGRALVAGGLPIAEITFRTPDAAEAIRRLVAEVPDITVGAGTVLTRDQADLALDAGATFLVAPGLDPAVVRAVHERGAVIVPGVATATEIQAALTLGLRLLKFFPAAVAGGPPFLSAVASVYPSVRFVPTGGVTSATLAEYLSLPNVVACGGSWMVRKELLAAGDFDRVAALTREAVEAAAAAR